MLPESDRCEMNDVCHHYSLLTANTFGIDVHASMFASPGNLDEVKILLETYNPQKLPFLILGEGSNVLFTRDFEGLILNPRIRGVELVEDNDDQVVVSVGAAENWDTWVNFATEQGWHGLENLSLIPGSVGSAPIQNIGAYGVELKDHFEWLDAWDMSLNRTVRLNIGDCDFGYRDSIFKERQKERYIITHVAFRLDRSPEMKLDYGNVGSAFRETGGRTPLDLRNVIIAIRRQKLPDPSIYGNAGSFFKNPLVDRTLFKCIRAEYGDVPGFPDKDNQVKISAAWLIDQAGWKGKRLGNVGTWPSQPLVIVNYGGATGEEILEFSEKIREEVDRIFGVTLYREVNVL